MKLRYTRSASRQLDLILDYIEARSPNGAQKVMDRIADALRLIAEHPSAGQATDKGDMRRLVVNPYPYVIFYRISGPDLVIHGVRHAARLRSG